MSKKDLVNSIDELLPQTQCGLCTYGGCKPYAEAIAYHSEKINLCPPGGTQTLFALATLLNQDATPYISEMEKKFKPPSIAIIREAECIGCTKCIQACPVDAILGTSKKMHTIIADECTGCELCIEPCPVDCIDMIPAIPLSEIEQKRKSSHARKRYLARNKRLQESKEIEVTMTIQNIKEESIDIRKAAIQEAIARQKAKKEQTNGC